MHIHFWTLRDLPEIERWDPDAEPNSFPTGYGHSFLEPYARIRGSVPTSIGRWPPKQTTCLVASFEELTDWRSYVLPHVGLQLALTSLRHRSVAVVRNDIPLEVPVPPFTGKELMPNAGSVTDPARQTAVPPFPQRGLIPRAPERGTSIQVVALKALRSNVPEWICDEELTAGLDRLGVWLRVDTENEGDAGWHDFRDVDAVICARRPHPRFDVDSDYLRKPPTKLINAWHAGAIPIVASETPYLDLVNEGVDALIADGPDALLRSIERLATDPCLVLRMQRAGRHRAEIHSVSAATSAWIGAVAGVPEAQRWIIARSIASMTYGCFRGLVRILRRHIRSTRLRLRKSSDQSDDGAVH